MIYKIMYITMYFIIKYIIVVHHHHFRYEEALMMGLVLSGHSKSCSRGCVR